VWLEDVFEDDGDVVRSVLKNTFNLTLLVFRDEFAEGREELICLPGHCIEIENQLIAVL